MFVCFFASASSLVQHPGCLSPTAVHDPTRATALAQRTCLFLPRLSETYPLRPTLVFPPSASSPGSLTAFMPEAFELGPMESSLPSSNQEVACILEAVRMAGWQSNRPSTPGEEGVNAERRYIYTWYDRSVYVLFYCVTRNRFSPSYWTALTSSCLYLSL